MSTYLSGYEGLTNPSHRITIPAGEQLSNAINTGGFTLVGLLMPSLFTGSSLSYFVADSAAGFNASGELIFTGNPSPSDTVTINGVVLTFVASSPGANEVLIGSGASDTASNLQDFLDATADVDLLECTYATVDTVLTVTAVTAGDDGNAITFDKSASNITINPTGGTLTGGGFRQIYDLSTGLPMINQVQQGKFYAVSQNMFSGIHYLKIQSDSDEASDRTVLCALKGF